MVKPVAWGYRYSDGNIYDVICPEEHDRLEGMYTVPLYTAPRELSDEEIDSVIVESFIGVLCGFYMFQDRPKEMQENYEVVLRFARAILKKASEK
jgi:hypothetical protein